MKISTINQVALYEEDGVMKFKSTVAPDTIMILRNKKLNQCRTVIVEEVSEDMTEVQFRLQGGPSTVFEAEKFNSEFEVMMFLQTPTDVKILSQMKETVDDIAKTVFDTTQKVVDTAYEATRDFVKDISEGGVDMPEADKIKESIKATKDKVVETVTSDETKEAVKDFLKQGKKLFTSGLRAASKALNKVSEVIDTAVDDVEKSATTEDEVAQKEAPKTEDDNINVTVEFKKEDK